MECWSNDSKKVSEVDQDYQTREGLLSKSRHSSPLSSSLQYSNTPNWAEAPCKSGHHSSDASMKSTIRSPTSEVEYPI